MINCEWSQWTNLGSCSQTCGSGEQIKTRHEIVDEQNRGICDGNATTKVQCNSQSCPGLNDNFQFKVLGFKNKTNFQY